MKRIKKHSREGLENPASFRVPPREASSFPLSLMYFFLSRRHNELRTPGEKRFPDCRIRSHKDDFSRNPPARNCSDGKTPATAFPVKKPGSAAWRTAGCADGSIRVPETGHTFRTSSAECAANRKTTVMPSVNSSQFSIPRSLFVSCFLSLQNVFAREKSPADPGTPLTSFRKIHCGLLRFNETNVLFIGCMSQKRTFPICRSDGIAQAGNSAAESAEELSYGKRAAHQAVVFLQQLRRNFAGGMPYFFRNTRVK